MLAPRFGATGLSMNAADRRRRQRESARRQREAELAARQCGQPRCVRRWGKHPCGGPLQTVTDELGRSHVVCAWCERHRRGLCIECPNRIRGRSKRCEPCKAKEAHRARLRFYERHRADLLAKMRAENARPEMRERKAAYKRAWRRLHPDLVRAQKRREMLRQPRRIRIYMARYRARHREHYRRMQLARYYRLHPQRPDPVCAKCGRPIAWTPPGRPPKRCLRCLPPCVRRKREEAAARKMARLALQALRPERKLRAPPATFINGDGTHRCCGAGCIARLEGRTKKCGRCKATDLQAAARVAQDLGLGRGRGRRPPRRELAA